MTTANLIPSVALAIEEVSVNFPQARILLEADGQGGARVCMDEIELRSPRFQAKTWIGFYVTFLYPNADIYPHYVRHDLVVNGSVTTPLHANHQWMGRSALMLSRRNASHDPSTDTAVLKLHKVIEWLNAQ